MDTVGLEKEKYRLGHTKVFIRAGVLGQMEEIREDRIGRLGALVAPGKLQSQDVQDWL